MELAEGYSLYSQKYNECYKKLLGLKSSDNIYIRLRSNSRMNPYGEALTIAEIDFVGRIESLGIKIRIIHNDPSAPTKDFEINGIKWELKTPITISNMIIRNTINKATDQNKAYVIIDTTFMEADLLWIFRKIKEHLAISKNNQKIKGLLVVRGCHLIRWK